MSGDVLTLPDLLDAVEAVRRAPIEPRPYVVSPAELAHVRSHGPAEAYPLGDPSCAACALILARAEPFR